MTPSTSLRLLGVAMTGALVLTACGDGPSADPEPTTTETATSSPSEPDATPSPTEDEPTSQPTTSPSPDETTAQAGGDVPNLGDRCRRDVELDQVDAIEFAAPDGWQVGDSCEFFDPAVEEVEPQTEPDVAVFVGVDDVPFHEAAEPDRTTRDEIRYVGARSGYQAIRVEAVSTGAGQVPEGEEILMWLVDLDAGTDDAGGTLVASARASDGADHELAAEALDRMMDTLRVRPVAEDAGDAAVVTRVEGGGTPWTVTLEGGCFRLHAGGPDGEVTDEACDLGAPDDSIQGAILEDDSVQVVVGLAPARTALVTSDAASAPYGAFPISLEGAEAFAYTPIDVPVDVRALDVEGQQLASAKIE